VKNSYSFNEAAAAEGKPCTHERVQLLWSSEIFVPGGSILHSL